MKFTVGETIAVNRVPHIVTNVATDPHIYGVGHVKRLPNRKERRKNAAKERKNK